MDPFAQLIGDSPSIQELRRTLKRLLQGSAGARRPPPILIQGETGTGKGLVARILHTAGARAAGPFVDINCAAIPDTLLEAELFGYERGAFTEARRSKPGLFLVAHRGTVFLDEIGLLPLDLQAKMLKVIEERAVRRLGATREEPIDVWILSATNEDLAASVRERRFREDLYHRLGVVSVTVPALRERGEDIARLAEHFLARACADYGLAPRRLNADARDRMLAHSWPGNVRELANVIERATVLSESAEITGEALGLPASATSPSASPRRGAAGAGGRSLQAAVRDHLAEVFEQTGGNISRMAAMLGISRATARAHVRRLGLAERSGAGGPGRPATRSHGPIALRPLAPSAPSVPEMAMPTDRPGLFRWERRFVASMRVSLGRVPDDAWTESGRMLGLVIDKIIGFGGRLVDLSPGGLEASFGIAPIEEAPRLAGHAALAVLAAAERARAHGDAGEAPGIVIHTDHALVGYFGAETACMDRDSRDRFAARIEPLAGLVRAGEILVTAPSAPLLGRRFTLEEGPLIGVAPNRYYRLLGRAPDGLGGWGQLAPFVGRRGEIERLEAAAAVALRGAGRVVDVVGEPGVGKSRLIREFVRPLEHGPWRVLEATCDGGGRALYHMAAGLLRSYFGIRLREPAEHVRAAVAGRLALSPELESSRAPLEALLGVASDDPRWSDLDPDERRQRTHEAVARLLTAESARRPLLVVIEDAHWIDAESQALLADLVPAMTAGPVLIIVSYRPQYHPRWGERAEDGPLRVEPLPDAIAGELLDQLAGRDGSLEAVKRQLVEWSGGNPFFLEESVRSLVEAGILGGVRGRYTLTRDAVRIEVPPTVEDILAARIDRLPAAVRHVVQTAAVIGRDVPSRLLAAVAGVSQEDLGAALGRLQESEILYERPGGPELDLVFKHAVTHEVARLGVPEPVRRRLHQAILAESERLYGNAADERVDLFAHHAVGGEVWDKALLYLNRSGHRALASAATQKAAECFEQALDALQHLPESPERWADAIDAHLNLRDALWPLARMSEVLKHLRDAEALAERIADVRRQGWTACYLCQYLWAVGDHEQALEAGDRARAIARDLDDVALAAESGFYRGIALLALGRVADAEGALALSVVEVDAALVRGEHRFPSRRFGRNGPVIVRGFLSSTLGELGRFAEGRRHGQAAIRIAEAAGSPFALVAAMGGLGALYVRQGDPANAIPILERGLAACRAHRLYNWFSHVAASLGRAYLAAGRIDEGRVLLEESATLGEHTGVAVDRARWLTYLGEGHLAVGRVGEAKRAADQALALARSNKERGHEAWALRLLGQVAVETGAAPDEAVALFRQALTLAEDLGLPPLQARCHHALGMVLARKDRAAAARHAERAVELAREIDLVLREGAVASEPAGPRPATVAQD